MLAGERLAVFVQQIELGHSGIVLAILCIQCFEAEIAALDSPAELHFLPAVSGFQRTVGNRFLTFQVQRLPLFTVGSRASAATYPRSVPSGLPLQPFPGLTGRG